MSITLQRAIETFIYVNGYKDVIPIMYRTYSPDGEDILAGYCRWERGEVISEDGDTYSLNDEIIKADTWRHVDTDIAWLVVWYESKWT